MAACSSRMETISSALSAGASATSHMPLASCSWSHSMVSVRPLARAASSSSAARCLAAGSAPRSDTAPESTGCSHFARSRGSAFPGGAQPSSVNHASRSASNAAWSTTSKPAARKLWQCSGRRTKSFRSVLRRSRLKPTYCGAPSGAYSAKAYASRPPKPSSAHSGRITPAALVTECGGRLDSVGAAAAAGGSDDPCPPAAPLSAGG
mmetsp:Transcript_13401/g.42069  ORF Transcript_13401/g.42069 Transcript_13401/m.42069 type:complete len:207 (+) Transcript_13401:3134-3754(+)